MQRIEVEGVWEDLHVPEAGADPDGLSFFEIDQSRCIGCDSCQRYCPVGAIQGASGRQHSITHKEVCIHCGQCLAHCPQGAIYEEHSWLLEVARRLGGSNSICVAIPDVAVRYALGEAFGLPAGVAVAGRMRAALAALGFAHCWDGGFAADVLACRLSEEFIRHLEKGGSLPLIMSACAGWQSYCEKHCPDLLPCLSACASPVIMAGALAKGYGAETMGYEPKKIYAVAISSCTAHRYEALRPEYVRDGMRLVDAVLTARELAYLIKKAGIDFMRLPEADEDPLMGECTGAANITCATGGLAEAVLRHASQALTGRKPGQLDFMPVRGMEGVRHAALNIGGKEVGIAAVHGAKHFPAVLDSVRKGDSPYHLVEFMACPGGCLCGGGQPVFPSVRDVFERGEEKFF